MELPGPNVRMKAVPTPFLVEDSEKGPAGAPCATGPISECPWCTHTFNPVVHQNLDELNKVNKKAMPTGTVLGGDDEKPPCGGNSAAQTKPQIEGRLAEHAACILMKCLLWRSQCKVRPSTSYHFFGVSVNALDTRV